MRRILVVAYYFPPIGGIGSIRLNGFVSFLPEFGWDPTVLSPLDTPHAIDESLSFDESKVTRAKSIEPADVVRRLTRSRRSEGAEAGVVNSAHRHSGVRANIIRFACFPDAQIGWYPAAVAAGLRLVRRKRFDAVFSSAFPVTAHLVAWSVSRYAGLPWVAEFRDPWSDRLPRSAHRASAARLERAISRRAGRVVVPSQALADHYSRRWGVDVAAIPNGFDISPQLARMATPPPESAAPVLAHVGSYYPFRQSLLTVWQALSHLRAAGHPIPRILWVGEMAPHARAEIASCGLLDALEVTGFVPRAKAIELLNSSTMLIASGEVDRGPLGAGTTAAKLFDYLASGRPILYVCNPAADAAIMLRGQDGCYVVEFGDVTATAAAITAGLRHGVARRQIDGLSRRSRTADLVRVLEDVL